MERQEAIGKEWPAGSGITPRVTNSLDGPAE